jgi:hypothetical protein
MPGLWGCFGCGAAPSPIAWRMNAADVAAGGIDNYCENVEKWASTIQEQLEGV